MDLKRAGNQTVVFANPPVILSSYSVVGPKEGQGPLGKTFSKVWKDQLGGAKSWEVAESLMLQEAMQGAIDQAGIPKDHIDYMLAGDLLNQIISSNFAARQMTLPFIGLYGACSTMALGLAVGSMLIDGGFAKHILVGVSSHHDTAERQFRAPTEQGTQRAMSAQWTVTGAGSVLLGRSGEGPRITSATIGRVVDFAETDVNNMGSAMAPAVADTILNHFHDLQRQAVDYDLIASGDLGAIGLALATEVLKQSGIDMGTTFTDCGVMVFDASQDVHSGASGCGCSSVVFAGNIMSRLKLGELKRVMLVGSGALHSSTSALQGESIPGIGHAVVIEARKE
ncbi:stage V sporulation protein AD [Desulfosporosinus sp. BICA1-9]|uniref:stage V sporulation protein AD n=1 Tax=Desulfosporosinus sp. BICA1-9 TaxID=1531958 RepID=UPI00054B14E6|nr:stage V sporulation protein AD [Desulfosporosinus sp. BICA1-9]KJS49851.1 MAG: stage V sporulation protein AD [Peptococcaceae bacterium BRH_c23]KJS81956.1 MAG: stage V sporulation protein AD [Desulfosporosinus sp. BICA1-9]HBW35741.1 stage V sporulation protein AD [Desulfosporosinus sp.]